MKEDGSELEKKARKLLNLKRVRIRGLYLSDVDNLNDYIFSINYLVSENYLVEVGSTVKDFHYEITSKGKQWIKNNN